MQQASPYPSAFYRDAAILATALAPGCDTVYPEDLNHGKTYAGVRVSDPFAG